MPQRLQLGNDHPGHPCADCTLEVRPVGEVPVDACTRHARLGGEVLQRGCRTLLGDHLELGIDELGLPALPVAGPARGLPRQRFWTRHGRRLAPEWYMAYRVPGKSGTPCTTLMLE